MVLMTNMKTYIEGEVAELIRTALRLKGMYEIDKAMTDEGWRLVQTWLRHEAVNLEHDAKSYHVEIGPVKANIDAILDKDVRA